MHNDLVGVFLDTWFMLLNFAQGGGRHENEAIGRVATFNQFKEIATFMLTLFIGYYYSYKNNTSENTFFGLG